VLLIEHDVEAVFRWPTGVGAGQRPRDRQSASRPPCARPEVVAAYLGDQEDA
jgi:hypothetical protein